MKPQAKIYIGIDTGTHTGFAVWDTELKKFLLLETLKIHQAMKQIEILICNYGIKNIHVRFEDARLRKWFGNAGREQLQGAGSIKRDCVIVEDFLTDLGVSFERVAPKNNITKLSAKQFQNVTGCMIRTTEHSRDSGMLIYKY